VALNPEPTTIIRALDGSILTITLNRPEKLNALNATMVDELIESFRWADQADEVRAIVVTGAGRGFCAGLELSSGPAAFEAGPGDADPATWRDLGGRVALEVFNCRKPVVAAVNGAAAGFGATFTLPMDARLASTTARFGFVFTRRGVLPEACSSWFLPRVVGMPQALDWMTSGRLFAADEALAGGLVRSVHPGEELLAAAYSYCHELIDQTAPLAVACTRRLLWRMVAADHPLEAHLLESRLGALMSRSPDAEEGGRSFFEKRPPRFAMKVSEDFPAILDTSTSAGS
jgi:enoyl-CoA hydratase/carnithine racemase